MYTELNGSEWSQFLGRHTVKIYEIRKPVNIDFLLNRKSDNLCLSINLNWDELQYQIQPMDKRGAVSEEKKSRPYFLISYNPFLGLSYLHELC